MRKHGQQNPRNGENPNIALVAGPAIFQSPKIAYMNVLLKAMSLENGALITLQTGAPISKVCKQLRKPETIVSALLKPLAMVVTLWITSRQTLTWWSYLHSSATLSR